VLAIDEKYGVLDGVLLAAVADERVRPWYPSARAL
jgi:hypothetical protein